MLENMNRILGKIDTLNIDFRNMTKKRGHRQQETFSSAMQEAMNGTIPISSATADSVSALDTGIALKLDVEIQKLVEKYSKDHDLKPELVRKLIAIASGNNPSAVSATGNLGLMQISPEIFKQSGLTNPFDPEQNIMTGTQHLANMLKQNGNSLPLGLSAYGSTPSAISRISGLQSYVNPLEQVLSGLNTKNK